MALVQPGAAENSGVGVDPDQTRGPVAQRPGKVVEASAPSHVHDGYGPGMGRIDPAEKLGELVGIGGQAKGWRGYGQNGSRRYRRF
jgi:hypothetical protein